MAVTARDIRCQVCGNDPSECNPEAHAAEARAQVYDYYEPPDDDRDYDPPEDATCYRCGDVGVEWNVEIQDAEGNWQTVCTECERPEDWLPEPGAEDADRSPVGDRFF